MKNLDDNPRRMLRLPEVQHLTGLSRATIYERVAVSRFPKPVSLGSRSVAWRCGDIYTWLDNRPVCEYPSVSNDTHPEKTARRITSQLPRAGGSTL